MQTPLLMKCFHISEIVHSFTGIECRLFDLESGILPIKSSCYCDRCCKYENTDCDPVTAYMQAVSEADSAGGTYIYCCPSGYIFIANTIYQNSMLSNGLITGPILTSDNKIEMQNISNCVVPPSNIPILSKDKVTELGQMINAMCSGLSTQISFHRSKPLISEHSFIDYSERYSIDSEKLIIRMVLSAEKEEAEQAISNYVNDLYTTSGYNITAVKRRLSELVVLISRAAIDGGADKTYIFLLNTQHIKELSFPTTIEELDQWSVKMIGRYINNMLDCRHVKHADIMEKALQYIRLNIDRKITLSDVAEHVYLSKSYLSRIFKKELGCTFTEYTNNLRVEKSKVYILDNSVSLVDIANAVGFEDQSYFTKVFKKTVGISPGRYRDLRGNI
ncbi:MAG: helix-turn-helix transcriptional regulator [Bacillota bacterium]|nr:helix-turn-helix transcriptional regulator [Bacillota bacterium]